jgi:choline-sulfatase
LVASAAVGAAGGTAAPLAAPGPTSSPPSVVLLTLDTTRSDHLGCYGAAGAATPQLDALAAAGTRYARALTSAPLTLPAHTSLLTGLAPPEHGVVDNGVAALAGDVPTLATAFADRGYATGAFVASRVLDRRFGLARGFDVYDDRMVAETLGEYGYPERDAAAVTSAAIAWLAGLPTGRPYFLWVHYYDPHAPYAPPAEFRGSTPERNYAGEIAYVDREVGRLLSALPGDPARRLVAAVGDHGEALGEHGEKGHGVFLYRASLEVPLILSGLGVPAGKVVEETVATRRLAPTLLALAATAEPNAQKGDEGKRSASETTPSAASLPGAGPVLPGLLAAGEAPAPQPVFSVTDLPASAYGWSPLTALSDQRWRLIVAPRPELYDFVADPGETRNLISERRDEARRLKHELDAREKAFARHAPAAPDADPQLAAQLRSLGYLSGVSGRHAGGGAPIDPKDGIPMLADMDHAKELMQAGQFPQAAGLLAGLVGRNPENVPFLSQLAHAQLGAGDGDAAIATYRRAVALNPGLDFLHLNLANALRQLGRLDEARVEYEVVVKLNPRAAAAWLNLGEMAHQAGRDEEERSILLRAVEAGTASAVILSRLGQIEIAAGRTAAGDGYFRQVIELTPGWAGPWLLWGQLAESHGKLAEAVERYAKAVEADPGNATALLRLGRARLASGDAAGGRQALERARAAGAGTPVAAEAERLLAGP